MELKTYIPLTNLSYYKDHEILLNKKKTDTINSKYGSYIRQSSIISNIPTEIIVSFIFIESAGNPNVVSPSGAVGLMQVAPISATDFLFMEKKDNRLNAEEKTVLLKTIGKDKLNQILTMSYLGQRTVITKEDLFNPELNILIGTIYLGLLIDRFTENNVVRLDKVAVQYNMGWFANQKGAALRGETNELVNRLNKESANYILKFVGTNGILTTLVA